MSKHTNIIEVPIATVARRTRQTGQTIDAVSTVVDLKAHHQAAAFENEALPADDHSNHLGLTPDTTDG